MLLILLGFQSVHKTVSFLYFGWTKNKDTSVQIILSNLTI